LSPDGRRRGDDLAAALLDAGVTAILTSQFRRTRETAQKVATVLGLTPVAIPVTGTIEQHVNALAAAVRNHRGGTILVVGHSNTVPALLKALGGPELPNLCETTFDRLFVLGLTDGKALLTRSRYGAASADDGPRCP
jgi:broad specificity phosphatase PhoE